MNMAVGSCLGGWADDSGGEHASGTTISCASAPNEIFDRILQVTAHRVTNADPCPSPDDLLWSIGSDGVKFGPLTRCGYLVAAVILAIPTSSWDGTASVAKV